MKLNILAVLALLLAVVSAKAVYGRSLQQAAPPTAEYRSLSQALAAQPSNLTVFLAAVRVCVHVHHAVAHDTATLGTAQEAVL